MIDLIVQGPHFAEREAFIEAYWDSFDGTEAGSTRTPTMPDPPPPPPTLEVWQ